MSVSGRTTQLTVGAEARTWQSVKLQLPLPSAVTWPIGLPLPDGNGNPIGQVTADGSGNWSYDPAPRPRYA